MRDISFDVREGEVLVIMELSGSGKSTLICTISRLCDGISGAIRIVGEDILAANEARLRELRRNKLGMVFQHFGLFPHMTIAEALKIADRIAIMRDGMLVQIGTPDDILLNPADAYVREFTRDVLKGRHAHVETIMPCQTRCHPCRTTRSRTAT